ncbi:hypothetical protein CXG50_13695 [Pseudomonas plecoglossicida]|nr:hypothetical protein CSW00_00410 [Pseudomonas sp. MR 02]PLP89713.1 hypothetical protein CX682_17280 [Pseudomonas sp. FFUP_PS_41]PLU96693.1 hypothetical protein CXG52_17460 [Pseudomonas plecoglossicida]PLV02323.1 hypothetical protein CXG48_17055 [Pseudomonas plecoglossicida]PLV08660.1 hypothetical protein CXG50_13695 [Pseudomonas plecoglossicida]
MGGPLGLPDKCCNDAVGRGLRPVDYRGGGGDKCPASILWPALALLCRSGLVSRKGREAAPGFSRHSKCCWGRFAALSRHKAAPTRGVAPVR